MDSPRFTPTKRTALDGRVWWVVFDNLRKCYSTFICHGKYATKRAAQIAIDFYNVNWGLALQ